MIKIEKTIQPNSNYSYVYDHTLDLFLDFNLEDIVLFDIETTGLSKTKNMIYLIGLAYYKNNLWHSIQYLATCLEDEKEMICNFYNIIANKKFLIHFNGNSFDIPFIKHKAKIYNLSSSNDMSNITNIDLYKLYTKYNKYLNFNNYKLTTIENNLGIRRLDNSTGKELIKVYYDFIKKYSLDILKNDFNSSNPLKEKLLLHNFEDVLNLVPLLNIYKYNYLTTNHLKYINYSLTNDYIIFHYQLFYDDSNIFNLPYPLSYEIKSDEENISLIRICYEHSNLNIYVKKNFNTLKYFYPNYKEYYYLPLEDTAIHKSVGQYVDREHRQNAKAHNCYIKKEATFIPIFSNTDNFTIFKTKHNAKTLYVELNDDLLNKNINTYAYELLKYIL